MLVRFFLLNRKLFGFPVRMVLRCEKKIRFPTKTVSKLSVHQDSKKVNFLLSPSLIFWLCYYCSTSLKKILSNKIRMETLRNIHYWVGFVLTQKWERIEVWIFVPELKTFRFVLSLENNFRNRFQRLLRGPNIVGKLLDIKKLNWITIRKPLDVHFHHRLNVAPFTPNTSSFTILCKFRVLKQL